MKLAIIERERQQEGQLRRLVKQWGCDRNIPVDTTVFADEEQFFIEWDRKRSFDGLLADVSGWEQTYLNTAKKLKEQKSGLIVIGMTKEAKRLQGNIDPQIVQWIPAPPGQDDLCACMDWALQRGGERQYLLISTAKKALKISARSIVYIESMPNGCVVEFCPQPHRTFRVHTTEDIATLEQRLDGGGFVRCHSAYLCRIDMIRYINPAWIEMKNGSRIMVCRNLYGQVRRSFVRYFKLEREKSGKPNAV